MYPAPVLADDDSEPIAESGAPGTLRIRVVGVGGAGGNAVANMIRRELAGVEFAVVNTDAQALQAADMVEVVQIGAKTTRGLGAGAHPDTGRAAAEESIADIVSLVDGATMLFITAGMGGGTGTGAAPVIARTARERGILTVAVVTKPFEFEGATRMRRALDGIAELERYVDTLITIPNQNLFRVASEQTTLQNAFALADEVLTAGIRSITDLMVRPGLVNLDFADVRAIVSEGGRATMGTGDGEGPRRALDAAEAAISNPLLEEASMRGARGVLVNVVAGPDVTLFEIDAAVGHIRQSVSPDANLIFGASCDDGFAGRLRVSVVATGIGLEETAAESAEPDGAAQGREPAEPAAGEAAPARGSAETSAANPLLRAASLPDAVAHPGEETPPAEPWNVGPVAAPEPAPRRGPPRQHWLVSRLAQAWRIIVQEDEAARRAADAIEPAGPRQPQPER
jgi:cell division protein FtsZ